jgi:hypothetical protein
MNAYPVPTILKLNFSFFLRMFMLCQTGPSVSFTDSHLSAPDQKIIKKPLFGAGRNRII